MTITGFVLESERTVEARDRKRPSAGEGEVLLRIERVGICGSDIEYYKHFRCGAFVPKEPFVLGHEFSGIVEEVGRGVTDVPLGARAAVEPSIPCGRCDYCREGRYNLCNNMRFFGSASSFPHLDGGFQELVSVPIGNLFVLPSHLGAAEGALLEPLAVAVHAVRRARPLDDANVLITGGGTIGQLSAMVARAYGARRITVSDPVAERRRFASDHGVDVVVDPVNEDLFEVAGNERRGGYDVAIEASGQEIAITQVLQAVRKGGRYVQVGTISANVSVPANLIMVKELNVSGSFRYNHDFPAALSLLAAGRIPAQDVISETLPFAKTKDAFEDAVSGGPLKVHVEM